MPKTKKETSEAEVKKTEEENIADIPKELRVFIEAGVQFGHLKSHVHPGMFPYIFGVRNNVHIIDVARTSEKLDEALEVIKSLAEEGKVILFVGTKLPMREAVKETAEAVGMPYLVNRWFGGTLTNWATISERVTHLKELKEKKGTEEWKKYPKHERLEMEKEIKKLEHVFGGIEQMEKLPDAVFITDARENEIATKEARRMKIKSIAITDTNVNPANVDVAIPANDDAVSSVVLILGKVREVILKNLPASSKARQAGLPAGRQAKKEK
ncbi:MAG: 30S ribosomal protein S2 [Candidatus Spechtbacterales bacterium]